MIRHFLAGAALLLALQDTAQTTGNLSGRVFDFRGQAVRAGLALYRETYDEEGNLGFARVHLGASGFTPTDAFLKRLGLDNPDWAESDNLPRLATNDLGEFRIRNVEPGPYLLYVEAGGRSAFYPGVTDRAKATKIEIRAGEENTIRDFTLNPGAEGMLRVRVIDQTGQALTTALVQVRRSGTTERLLQQSYSPGRLSDMGRLPLGSYDVEAILGGNAPSGLLAAASVSVQMLGADREVEIKVPRGIAVTGRAMTEPVDGISKPVAGIRLDFAFSQMMPGWTMPLTSSADGSFKTGAVPQGVVRIAAVSGVPTGMCLSGVAQGRRDVLREGLNFASLETQFIATLRASTENLSGVVRDTDGKPIAKSLIAVVPDDPERKDAYAAMSADSAGAFQFQCLTPGSYHLYAWKKLDGAAYKNAEFMKPFEGRGVSVRLQKGLSTTVNVSQMEGGGR